MKVRAIIQARMGSTRLRGKSLMPVGGVPLLLRVIRAVFELRFVDDILVATTDLSEDDAIVPLVDSAGVRIFRGSALNVLERFHNASIDMNDDDCIVRVTADNPFNNADITSAVFDLHKNNQNEYTCIDGLSHIVNEFIRVGSLRSFYSSNELNDSDREHVTPFFRRNKNRFKIQELPSVFMGLRPELDKLLTIDTINDFNRIEELTRAFNINEKLDFIKVYQWLEKNNK